MQEELAAKSVSLVVAVTSANHKDMYVVCVLLYLFTFTKSFYIICFGSVTNEVFAFYLM